MPVVLAKEGPIAALVKGDASSLGLDPNEKRCGATGGEPAAPNDKCEAGDVAEPNVMGFVVAVALGGVIGSLGGVSTTGLASAGAALSVLATSASLFGFDPKAKPPGGTARAGTLTPSIACFVGACKIVWAFFPANEKPPLGMVGGWNAGRLLLASLWASFDGVLGACTSLLEGAALSEAGRSCELLVSLTGACAFIDVS